MAAVKIISGLIGHSYALIADGIESILDILSSIAVWGSLKIAAVPPNERYPFGYGRAEPLAALVVASGLMVAATGIAIQSIREIMTPHHMPKPFTLVVLVLVILIKELMFRFMFRAGQSIGSQAMQVYAWHHRSDSITSLAALIGISVAIMAGEGYESADDWAALFACAIIYYNGIRLFKSALEEVLDAAPPPEIENQIRDIASGLKGVREIEKCRVRKSGMQYFVEIHVEVDGELTVNQGHEIAHQAKAALLDSELSIADAVVHIEPHP